MHQDLQEKRIERIMDTDLSEMTAKYDKILKETVRQTTQNAEAGMRVDKALKRLEPLHDRMHQLE